MIRKYSKTNSYLHNSGFTVIELLFLILLITVLSVISTPYLFGMLEKHRLAKEVDAVYSVLQAAQQAAMNARENQSYRVELDQSVIRSALQTRPYRLKHGVELDSEERLQIEFQPVSGYLRSTNSTNQVEVIFSSGRFEQTINVNAFGYMDRSPIRKTTAPEER